MVELPDGGSRHTCLVQPGRCRQSHRRGQLEPPAAALLLDHDLRERPLAADSKPTGDRPERRELQGREQVIDVAQLPQRLDAPDGQQPGSTELAQDLPVVRGGQADEGGRAEHGDRQARPAGVVGEPFDLDVVTGERLVVSHASERSAVKERYRVVGKGPVDVDGRAQHDPRGTDLPGRFQQLGGAADVQGAPRQARQRHVVRRREVHHGRGAGEPLRQQRVPHVEGAPLDPVDPGRTDVEPDQAGQVVAPREPLDEGTTEPGAGAGDGDDLLAGRTPKANHLHRFSYAGRVTLDP